MDFIDYLDMHFGLEYVSGDTQVKLSGACPFCGESRTDLRLYVNAETGRGKCFHCGRGFYPLTFIMAHERCGLKQAEAILNDDDGYIKGSRAKRKTPDVVFPAITAINDCPDAAAYLETRGIQAEAIRHFKLYFTARDVMIGERLFHSAGRIVIPIHDIDGRPVSWQARDITGKGRPKYLFPPGFKGSESLYNAWSIPKASRYLIVCEGVMDVFGWWQAGARNAVATFGKSMSVTQIDLIDRIRPEVLFVAWDSDATWSSYELMERLRHRYDVRFVDLEGRDSDEKKPSDLARALCLSKSYCWEDKILSSL